MACFKPTLERSVAGEVCVPPNEHLVFVGDSTMRYQFLMLAHALGHGSEPVSESVKDGRVLHDETTWGGWPDFFNGTTAMLDLHGRFNGKHASCDCFRLDGCCHQAPGVLCMKICTATHKGHRELFPIIENRYVRLPNNVTLSFFLALGLRINMKGSIWPHHALRALGMGASASSSSSRSHLQGSATLGATVQAEYAPIWEYNLTDFVTLILPQLRPTLFVLNVGLWLGSCLKCHANDVPFAWLGELVRRGAPHARTVWKTTTYSPKRTPGYCETCVASAFADITLDAFNMTYNGFRQSPQGFFIDYGRQAVHVNARVNNELNRELLRLAFPSRGMPS